MFTSSRLKRIAALGAVVTALLAISVSARAQSSTFNGEVEVSKGDSGVPMHSVTVLHVEGSGNTALQISGGSTGGHVLFGEGANGATACISYYTGNDHMMFSTDAEAYRVMIDDTGYLTPVLHEGSSLGTDDIGWNYIYTNVLMVETIIERGLVDFSSTSTLSFLRGNPLQPKPTGAYDEFRRPLLASGIQVKELDPGCLPRELTGYYARLEDYQKNTDPDRVRQRYSADPEPPLTKLSEEEIAQRVESHIEDYMAENKHPDALTPAEWGISIGDMAGWNYAAIRELALENTAHQEAASRILQELAQLQADSVNLVSAAGLVTAEDLENWEPGEKALGAISDAVLTELGRGPELEVPFAEAWEEVQETQTAQVARTVTKYRIDWDTMQVEPYQVEETVGEEVPTGRTIKRLKEGVRFDENTGKCYAPAAE